MSLLSRKRLAKSFALSLVVHSLVAFAEPDAREYPEIYPFVPFEESEILQTVKSVSEDNHFLHNIYDLHTQGLSQGKTKVQPWMSTYWPLNKGLIADPYVPKLQVFKPGRELSWKHNYKRYLDRRENVHAKINELSEDELAKLAPSEKYDLLLGDLNFDLTNRIWEYAQKWGSDKENSFLASLNIVGGNSL